MFHSAFLSAYEIFQCLYVDDGAFPFDTQDSLSKGMNLVFKHFTRFGLEMHIGRNGGESKTECVFYPPPQILLTVPAIDNQRTYQTSDQERDKKRVHRYTSKLPSGYGPT
jgi:hypothetical protein